LQTTTSCPRTAHVDISCPTYRKHLRKNMARSRYPYPQDDIWHEDRVPTGFKDWPGRPHSCGWCRRFVLDFRGSKNHDRKLENVPSQISWKDVWKDCRDERFHDLLCIPMYAANQSVLCGDLLIEGKTYREDSTKQKWSSSPWIKRMLPCEFVHTVLDNLQIPTGVTTNIRVSTTNGTLLFSSDRGTTSEILVDTISGEPLYELSL
jgi:hypothetical protein